MSDELIEAIDHANAGNAPPPFGRLVIDILGAPVSVQSAKKVRDAYIASIKSKLSCFRFILTGQITLEIVWLLPAKSRFETDAKADIDNCIKPIIDAFTGPNGIFIDDCQLKGLYICWRHVDTGDERLKFQFDFDPDQWCEKEGLAFIRLERGLCCPVSLLWPKEAKELWTQAMISAQSSKDQLEKRGVSYLFLAGMTGGSQPFHITRTSGFPLLSTEEWISRNAVEL